MNLQRQPLMHTAQTRMFGRAFVDGNAEELRQRTAVAATPGDAALRADALEVAHEDHAKVDARRNRWPTELGGVIRLAAFFDPAIKVGFGQHLVQFLIERMPRRFRQLGGGDPKPLLFTFAFTQRHGDLGFVSVDITADADYYTMPVKRPFST